MDFFEFHRPYYTAEDGKIPCVFRITFMEKFNLLSFFTFDFMPGGTQKIL